MSLKEEIMNNVTRTTLILSLTLIFSFLLKFNCSYANDTRNIFNGKKYDILLKMEEMKVEVTFVCHDNNLDYSYVSKIMGSEELIFDNKNYNILDEYDVYMGYGESRNLMGTLSEPASIDNEELVTYEDRNKCFNSNFHIFTARKNLLIKPIDEINFHIAIKKFRCKYNKEGEGILVTPNKPQEVIFFISNEQNKVLNEQKTMLTLNHNTCVNLKSFLGDTIHVIGDVMIAIVAVPLVFLIVLLGGWGGC